MARLKYNGLATTLGAALTSGDTTITFATALTHSGGTAVPTITGTDYIPLAILDASGALSEIVSLTAYTTGATSGTISRAQESTTAVAHASGDAVVHGPTVADFAASTSGGDTAWTAPTFTNGWTNYGSGFSTAGYRKDASGFVHLKGVCTAGSTSSAFTLPAGYRPAEQRVFAVSSDAAFGQVNVTTAGVVTQNGGYAPGKATSFDGIVFLAEA